MEDSQKKIARRIDDYYFGGSGGERTLRENRKALDSLRLIPRAFQSRLECDTTTNLGGVLLPLPIAVAPMAYLSLLAAGGEETMARSAAKAGISFILSTRSAIALEKVAETFNANRRPITTSKATAALFFQLYLMKDRQLTFAYIDRAKEAGFDGFVLTVDAPYIFPRRRDRANGFVVPEKMVRGNLPHDFVPTPQKPEATLLPTQLLGRSAAAFDDALVQEAVIDPDIVAEVARACSPMPLVVKGVMAPQDIAMAGALASGAIVSNHGARQLDGAITAVDAMALFSESHLERPRSLWMDGAVSFGSDLIRAVALGCDGALVGKAFARALRRGGEAELKKAISLIKEEFQVAMALVGAQSIGEITRAVLYFG